MRVFDQGSFYRVTVSRAEVEAFARRWPCFGRVRAVWFEFDRRNGDLVDLCGDRGMDGAGVAALSRDAQSYGLARIEARERRRARR